MKTRSNLLLSLLLMIAVLTHAKTTNDNSTNFLSWTPTPPMGWNSFDCYGTSVTEQEVKANADFMAKHLKQFGWDYVVIDINWYIDNESFHGYNKVNPIINLDAYGRFIPSPVRFPSSKGGKGFKPLADYIHSKGLKFGVHVMRGIPKEAVRRNTPIQGSMYHASDVYTKNDSNQWNPVKYTVDSTKPGAQEYYNSLFNLYAQWGIDFVKIDDLSFPYYQNEIEMIRKAIDQCGRKIVLSMSPGETPVINGNHAKMHANMWRIIGDLWDNWMQVNDLFDICSRWAPYVGDGHWPDMDMLPLGHIGIRSEVGFDRRCSLLPQEQRMLLTLFAMFRSPLMIGGDLPTTDEATIKMLTNKELLYINQRSTDNRELLNSGKWVVWTAKDPATDDKFLAVFNRDKLIEADDGKAFWKSDLLSAKSGKCSVDIDVDLPETKKLYLCISDGGDGSNWDHADWIAPKLSGAKGEIRLTDLDWIRATAGWRGAIKGSAVIGDSIRFDGKGYKEGIGAHAPSVIEYDMPKGYSHFSAKGVVDDVALGHKDEGTSVRFMLLKDGDVNITDEDSLTIDLSELGIDGPCTFTNVWTGENTSHNGKFVAKLQPHDAVLYRISSDDNVEVGPYTSSEPYGVTILVNRSAAFVVSPKIDLGNTWCKDEDEALLPYSICAPDGSFVSASATSGDKPFTITYGKIDNKTVGIVLSSSETMDLTLKWRQPFSACKTIYWADGNKMRARGVAANSGRSYPLDIKSYPEMTGLNADYKKETTSVCHLNSQRSVVLVLTVGKPTKDYSQSEIISCLEEAGKAYQRTQASASGDWGNFVGAIEKTMNGSRLYSSLDHRIAHCIGRGWWMARQSPYNKDFIDNDDDLMPYFAWDSFFNADLASIADKESAHETVRAMLSVQLENGQVPNYAHWPCSNEYITPNKTNPPVAAMCVWKLHQRHPDMNFLKEVYPKLAKWHEWFKEGRRHKNSYLLSWGDGKGLLHEAVLESGWDDTPAFDGAEMKGTLMNIYCVDLSSLWAADAEYLAKISTTLGFAAEAEYFKNERDSMVNEINSKLWNEKLGMYCNRYIDDNADGTPRFQTRFTPLNFYPLICGAPDSKRAKRVLSYLHNPKKFWGQYLVPTVPYDDPLYPNQSYWRGHIWGPCNYLVWQGVKRYDDTEHISQYAERSVNLFMRNWNTPLEACAENYMSTDGSVGDDPHYTWGALLPLIGVEALLDIDDNCQPIPGKAKVKGGISLHNIPVGGQMYTIEVENGKTSIKNEGYNQ